MSDQYVEKIFLYFVVLSVIVHALIFTAIIFLPEEKHAVKQEPYMVDLEDIPQPKNFPIQNEKEAKRHAPVRNRVRKEIAPKGEMPNEHIAGLQKKLARPIPQFPQKTRQSEMEQHTNHESKEKAAPIIQPGKGLLKPEKYANKGGLPGLSELFPSETRLSRLEDNYRKKYEPDVEEGETKFLNTDDIYFGSFLHRFENAVYGVWRYPSEAAQLGMEGVAPVKITFNRKGEIENIRLLESSGSRILDDEVFRTLHMIGPIGSFPRGYDKEKFSLIAFFQYRITRGSMQGILR